MEGGDERHFGESGCCVVWAIGRLSSVCLSNQGRTKDALAAVLLTSITVLHWAFSTNCSAMIIIHKTLIMALWSDVALA